MRVVDILYGLPYILLVILVVVVAFGILNALGMAPTEIENLVVAMFGMIIPRDYGGLGFSAQAHSAVVMKLASRNLTSAITVMVPNSLGPAELLAHYGTQEQREHYLPRLARGEEIPCFALTGPRAGSDAGAIPDTGVICKGSGKAKR